MSKFRNLIESILLDAKQVGNLYHATSLIGLKGILDSNQIISNANSTGCSGGISTSRDKTLFYGGPVALILDGDKLSENYKVLPYSNFPDLSRDNDKIDPYGEHETIIVPNNIPKGIDIYDYIEENDLIIPNINKYLKGILVLPSIFKSAILTQDLYKILSEYNYPVYIQAGQQLDPNKFLDYYNEMKVINNKPFLKQDELFNRLHRKADNIYKLGYHDMLKTNLDNKLNKDQEQIINNAIEKDTGKTINDIWQNGYNGKELHTLQKEYENKLFTTSNSNSWYKFQS